MRVMNWREFLSRPWLRLKAAEVPFDPGRRAFIGGAAAVVAATAIMPVRAPALVAATDMPVAAWVDAQLIYEDEAWVANNYSDVIRRAFVPRLYAQVYKQLPSFDFLLAHTEVVASHEPDEATRRALGLPLGVPDGVPLSDLSLARRLRG